MGTFDGAATSWNACPAIQQFRTWGSIGARMAVGRPALATFAAVGLASCASGWAGREPQIATSANGRPESAGPPLKPGLWRLSDDAGQMPSYCIRQPQKVTRLIVRVGNAILTTDQFHWRREGANGWRFQSHWQVGDRVQDVDARTVGDFRRSFAFAARVLDRGSQPDENRETIVRVRGRHVSDNCGKGAPMTAAAHQPADPLGGVSRRPLVLKADPSEAR